MISQIIKLGLKKALLLRPNIVYICDALAMIRQAAAAAAIEDAAIEKLTKNPFSIAAFLLRRSTLEECRN